MGRVGDIDVVAPDLVDMFGVVAADPHLTATPSDLLR